MDWNLRKLLKRVGTRQQRRPGDPGRLHLWPIGVALTVSFLITLAALAALTWTALALLHHPRLPAQKTISVHDAIGVAQLVFASVAGAGALVALVMAYRRQRVAETTSAHDRTRVLNERFIAIAAQLGDAQAAVRLAGVHAMAGLADDWQENRQTCIDVLCAYLRMPYEPDPGEEAAAAERLAFRGSREVRHTVIQVIAAHLRNEAAMSWQGLNFAFTGMVFDGGSFAGVEFSSGKVSFDDAKFSSGIVNFYGTRFSGGTVTFNNAEFCGGTIVFNGAKFSGGKVSFYEAKLSAGEVSFYEAKLSAGEVSFHDATFSGGTVNFDEARFSGGEVSFHEAEFPDGEVSFHDARFSGGAVYFDEARFSGGVVSFGAVFSGGEVSFGGARFFGGVVDFGGATFSGGVVDFDGAAFPGGTVSFGLARFSGGGVDFSGAADWSHPPTFDWDNTPPSGVGMPDPTG